MDMIPLRRDWSWFEGSLADMSWALGATEFQLTLLRRMADYQPELVAEARRGLGVSITEMRQANADWQRFCRSRTAPRGVGRYRAVLGPPESSTVQKAGDLTVTLHHWRLDLWPELRFEVVAGPGGEAWQEWLVRPRGASPPPMADDGELEPWGFVVGDLAGRYEGVRHLPPDAPSRWVTEFRARGAGGGVVVRRARFVWGLLQEVSGEG